MEEDLGLEGNQYQTAVSLYVDYWKPTSIPCHFRKKLGLSHYFLSKQIEASMSRVFGVGVSGC